MAQRIKAKQINCFKTKNSVLNCDKIENEIKKSLPEWQYHTNHYLDNWAKNYE